MNGYKIYLEILFFVALISLIIIFAVNFIFNKIFNRYMNEIKRVINLLIDDINSKIENKDVALTTFYDSITNLQRVVRKREHYHNEIFKILNSAAINIELDKFLEDFIPKLLSATDSMCSAFYLLNNFTNKMEIKYSSGFNKNIYREFDLSANEILVSDLKVKVVNEIPEDTVYMIKTFVGKVKPKSIMQIPIVNENKLIGILVFASIYNYTDEQVEIIDLTKHYLGIAVNNGIIFERTKRLTNELQFQNKLIQDLNDELEKKLKDLSQ